MIRRIVLGLLLAGLVASAIGLGEEAAPTAANKPAEVQKAVDPAPPAAAPAVAAEPQLTTWPHWPEECEPFRKDICQYRLCLCYVDCNPPEGSKAPVNQAKAAVCAAHYPECKSTEQSEF